MRYKSFRDHSSLSKRLRGFLDGNTGTPIGGIKPTAGSGLAAVRIASEHRIYYVDAKNEINECQLLPGVLPVAVQRGLGALVLPGGQIDAVAFGEGEKETIRIFFQSTNGALCRKIYSGNRWVDEIIP